MNLRDQHYVPLQHFFKFPKQVCIQNDNIYDEILMKFSLDKNQHIIDFLALIRGSSELQPLFEGVQKDSIYAAGDGMTMMDQS